MASSVRSGYVGSGYGSARHLGINAYNWSITASPVSFTGSSILAGYYLAASDESIVGPSNGPQARWLAFPIRCLAY